MTRFVLAIATIAVLWAATFLIFFLTSRYHVEDQSTLKSLSDFVFMLSTYNAQGLGLDPPMLNDKTYERVMTHARNKAHREVKERVVWSLARWGETVAPRLVHEIDRPSDGARMVVAAEALAKMGSPHTVPSVRSALERPETTLYYRVHLIDALAELGPEAGPTLVDTYLRCQAEEDIVPYSLLDAIGRSRGGTDFLLDLMERATTADDILELQWALAFTRDERAARVLVSQLHHPVLHVRRRARDSMAQSMGVESIEAATDLLEHETDDYVRSWILQSLLAKRAAADVPRVVKLLGELLRYPPLAWEANYALARIATDEAIGQLKSVIDDKPARWVMSNLEYSGDVALRILEDYVHHEDRYVRRAAVLKILELGRPEAISLLEQVRNDPDPYTRQWVETGLHQADLLLLEASARDWISQRTGSGVGRLRPPNRKGVRMALLTLSALNWIGLGASVLLGFLLLAGWVRAFEHYKFALVLQFLLVLGIVGDFFFFYEPALYLWATSGRLVLLVGLLFLRDDPLPGETRGRVERLAVRSLWVLVPLLVVFGAPVISEALRLAFRDFDFVKWVLLLLMMLTVLIVEQAVVPWDLFPRRGRAERALAFVGSTAVVAVFAVALWRWIAEVSPAEGDRAVFGALLLLPMVGAVIFHLKESRLFGPRPKLFPYSRPPGRIRVVSDSESLLVRLKKKHDRRGLPHLLFGSFLLVATWWLSHSLEVGRSGGAGMFLLMIIAVFGTALVSVLLSGFVTSQTIQVRPEAVRSAGTFLGGAFGKLPWYRKPRLPVLVGRLSLSASERRWLTRLLNEVSPKSLPMIALKASWNGRSEDDSVSIALQVKNVGSKPVRLADVEAAEGKPWTVEVDSQRGHAFFSRDERESSILPGKSQTFHPRVYLGQLPTSGSMVLRCGSMGPRTQCEVAEA